MDSKDIRNLQEAYLDVYDNIMEKEDSEYEKASDAALDSRYGYGRATGDKRSFGRAANRSSAAAALRALRRGERSGSGTSREAGSDAVHQGWAKTAKTSTDQTPEKKERRAGLANTPYSNLPDDEKEKDRVSFDAVRATYNKNKNINASYEPDLYDVILEYLITEGYADTNENALVIMANMSENWKQSIMEGESTVLAAKGGVAGAVQVKQTQTPGFLGTGIGSKTVSTPIPGTFTRNTPERIQNGPREFDAYGSGSKGAEAEMGDRSGPTDAERSRYNSLVTRNNTVGDKSIEPSPQAVNQRSYKKGHSGLMPERGPYGEGGRSTSYTKPNDSWRGY